MALVETKQTVLLGSYNAFISRKCELTGVVMPVLALKFFELVPTCPDLLLDKYHLDSVIYRMS